MSKDIVTYESEYSALAPVPEGQAPLAQIIQVNMGGKIDPGKLDRVKVPAGGALSWEVPNLEGNTDSVKELTGVIVGAKDTRVYFPDAYDGSNTPPACASNDGITGVGEPGGKCATCPLSKFGPNGERPPCSQRKLVLLLPKDSVLPLVLNLPPSSVGELERYFLRLSAKSKFLFQVETSFKLEKDKSSGGVTYSKAMPSFSKVLGAEEGRAAQQIFNQLQAALGGIKIEEEMAEVPF